MESEWLKNKVLQPTEIPDPIMRKGIIILSDKCCIAIVEKLLIYWDGKNFENTQEMKEILFKYLMWEERGT